MAKCFYLCLSQFFHHIRPLLGVTCFPDTRLYPVTGDPSGVTLSRLMPAGFRPFFRYALLLATAGTIAVSAASPAPGKPTGKFYVASVKGSAEIYIKDGPIYPLAPKAVFSAEGNEIVTGPNSTVTLVFSNSTSVTCAGDTRLHILKFSQQPLKPNVTDLDDEPSVSQMQVFIDRGTVSVTTPNLAAGSSCTWFTAQGQVSIRDVQAVINVQPSETIVSMLAGDATARTETLDGGVHMQQGQQVIMRNGLSGQPEPIEVQPIPTFQLAQLTSLSADSSMARKMVYFAPVTSGGAGPTLAGGTPVAGKTKSTDSSTSTSTDTGSVFDENSNLNSNSANSQNLQPVQLVPANLPVQFTVSPARIGG
jgi:hypothetical protein